MTSVLSTDTHREAIAAALNAPTAGTWQLVLDEPMEWLWREGWLMRPDGQIARLKVQAKNRAGSATEITLTTDPPIMGVEGRILYWPPEAIKQAGELFAPWIASTEFSAIYGFHEADLPSAVKDLILSRWRGVRPVPYGSYPWEGPSAADVKREMGETVVASGPAAPASPPEAGQSTDDDEFLEPYPEGVLEGIARVWEERIRADLQSLIRASTFEARRNRSDVLLDDVRVIEALQGLRRENLRARLRHQRERRR